MRIGAVAERAGVSVRALRYYEEQQLLEAERSPSGQRHYADTAVDRVKFIQLLYAAGLSSSSIRQLLPCVYSGRASQSMLDHLTQEREKLDQQIASMAAVRDRMDAVITATALTMDGHVPNCTMSPEVA